MNGCNVNGRLAAATLFVYGGGEDLFAKAMAKSVPTGVSQRVQVLLTKGFHFVKNSKSRLSIVKVNVNVKWKYEKKKKNMKNTFLKKNTKTHLKNNNNKTNMEVEKRMKHI